MQSFLLAVAAAERGLWAAAAFTPAQKLQTLTMVAVWVSLYTLSFYKKGDGCLEATGLPAATALLELAAL